MKKLLIAGLLGLCLACSIMDPDIPAYDSSQNEVLPGIEILSVDNIYTRQVNLKISIKGTDIRKPSKIVLCYSKDHDLPDITDEVIDLLPDYRNGVVNKIIFNLRPSTLYYSRVYVETTKASSYSNSFEFKTNALNANQAWEKVSYFPVENNWYETIAVIDQDVYIRGSSMEDGMEIGNSVIWKYTPSSNSWKKISRFPGVPRIEPVRFSIGSRLYMGMGAILVNGNYRQYQRDFWEYDPAADSWRKLCDFPRGDCLVMGAFESEGKGYLIFTDDTQYPETILFSYDPAEDLWKKKTDFPGVRLSRTLFLTVRHRLFLLARSYPYGEDNLFPRVLWEYELDTNTWFRKTDFPGVGKWSPVGFVVDDRLYAGYGEVVGSDEMWRLLDELWEYNIDKDIWEIRSSFTAKPYLVSLSFSVGGTGYMGSAEMGLWKYTPEKDK